jgi:hypothetical protein
MSLPSGLAFFRYVILAILSAYFLEGIVKRMPFVRDDGGRSAAGFASNNVGDCVCRSVAIASGRPYHKIYDALARGNETQRRSKRTHPAHCGVRSASDGVYVQRKWFKDYMRRLGFEWVPTMRIGQGCKVHLRANELPKGRLVVEVSKHSTAVIDGVIHDTYDPSRNGTRCVYGYWTFKGAAHRKQSEGAQAKNKRTNVARRDGRKRVKKPLHPVRRGFLAALRQWLRW